MVLAAEVLALPNFWETDLSIDDWAALCDELDPLVQLYDEDGQPVRDSNGMRVIVDREGEVFHGN